MKEDQLPLHLCIAGSHDFVRRFTLAAEEFDRNTSIKAIEVHPANLAELKSAVIEHRAHAVLVEIGLRLSASDAHWLKQVLSELRERFGKIITIIAAVTSPEKFVSAGNLLFADENTLTPSGLIDNFIFSPPHRFPFAAPLENQLRDCLSCIIELRRQCAAPENPLPPLGDANWVPAMADPESRSVWMRWLPRYARYTSENPLIVGPTGSGKTKLAAALHELSGRKGPFVSITPRDFSSTELVQAELFGAVAGAYTGAVDKWGLVKRADKGTLFIDELQSIDLDLQGKLITFIENKTYRRVGEAESHNADVRFVFASNRTLQDLVNEGKLRDDFAYRLERLQLVLKPLHERRLDIAAGICFALGKVLRERSETRRITNTPAGIDAVILDGLSQSAYFKLFCQSWPGNLRQLENTVAKLIELGNFRNLRLIDEECVEEALQGLLGTTETTGAGILSEAMHCVLEFTAKSETVSLREIVTMIEDNARTKALEYCGGNTAKAAALLGDSPLALELFASVRSCR